MYAVACSVFTVSIDWKVRVLVVDCDKVTASKDEVWPKYLGEMPVGLKG